MNKADIDLVAQLVGDALEGNRKMLEALLTQKTEQYVDASMLVEQVREEVDTARERLVQFLDAKTSGAVDAMQRQAADEVNRLHSMLMRRMDTADALLGEVTELRRQLADAGESLRNGTDGASAFEIAQAEGFEGDVGEWLEELRSKPPSALEVARELAASSEFRELVRGADGANGAGVETPAWEPGIHREGVLVQAYFGQFYRALRDTAAEPYGSPDWKRIGSAGLHIAEPFAEGRNYATGDLFVRDFGLFAWDGKAAHLLVGRGPKGDKGEPGAAWTKAPRDGDNGKDGARLEAAELRSTTLVLVMRESTGKLANFEVELLPVFEQLGNAIEERVTARVIAQLAQEARE